MIESISTKTREPIKLGKIMNFHSRTSRNDKNIINLKMWKLETYSKDI